MEDASLAAAPPEDENWWLHVRVLGLPDDVRQPAMVSFQPEPFVSELVPWGRAAAHGGAIRFDVTDLVRKHRGACVRVAGAHPDHVTEPATVWLPAARPESGIVSACIRMWPAHRVRGRVVDAEGEPIQHACVMLFPMEEADHARDDEACPILSASAWTRSGPDGRYELKTASPGHHVVAAGLNDGWVLLPSHDSDDGDVVPDGEGVEIPEEGPCVPRDLVLRKGVSIEGVCRIRGRPTSAGSVLARFTRPPDSAKLDTGAWPWWVWTGQRVVPLRERASVSSGSFRIEGLAAGPHRVSFFPHYSLAADPALVRASRFQLEAPCCDVVLDVDGVVVTVRPRDADDRLEEAWVEVVAGTETLSERVGRDGVARFLLCPGATYTVRLRSPRRANTETRHTVPLDADAVTWSVDAPPVVEPAVSETGSLAVRVRAPCGVREPRAAVFLLDTDGEARRIGCTGEGARVNAQDVPVGWWRVQARPLDVTNCLEGHEQKSPFLLAVEDRVFVQSGATARLDLTLGVGGLIEIAACDATGRSVGADARLCDDRGQHVGRLFVAWEPSPSGYFGDWIHCEDCLGPYGPHVTDRALPPGRYQIEVHADGRTPLFRTVEVRAGEVARVEVAVEG